MKPATEWKQAPDFEREGVVFRLGSELRAASNQRALDRFDESLAAELHRRGILVSYDPGLWISQNGGFTDSVDLVLTLASHLVPSWGVTLYGRDKVWMGDAQKGEKHATSDGPYDSPAVALLLAILLAWRDDNDLAPTHFVDGWASAR